MATLQIIHMLNTAIALLLLSGAISVAIGFKYLLARQFMPYQAAVVQTPWSDIPVRIRAVVLGMLKVIGAGICVFGISLCWLTVPLSKGELWPVPAIILITAVSGFVTLYVTTGLRKLEPTARPPIRPTIVLMLMVSVAMVLAQFK